MTKVTGRFCPPHSPPKRKIGNKCLVKVVRSLVLEMFKKWLAGWLLQWV